MAKRLYFFAPCLTEVLVYDIMQCKKQERMLMKRYYIAVCLMGFFVVISPVNAGITVTSSGTVPTQMPAVVAENTQPAVIDNEAEYLQKKAFYEQLKQQADEIARNKLACDKAKKGWLAGTIIGGAGVVGTTIGAAVQAKKIKDEKNEISEKQNTLKNLQ